MHNLYKVILCLVLVFSAGCSMNNPVFTGDEQQKRNLENDLKAKKYIQVIKFKNDSNDDKIRNEITVLQVYAAALKAKEEQNYKEYEFNMGALSLRLKNYGYSGALKDEINKAIIDYEKSVKSEVGKNDKDKQIAEVKISNEDTIKESVKSVLGYNNTDITVVETEQGFYGVTVKAPAKMKSLTDKTLIKENLKKCVETFDRVYHAYNKIAYVCVILTSDGTDKYGNNRSGVAVMKCTLRNATALKINWSNLDAVRWEEVLDEYRVHKDLQP